MFAARLIPALFAIALAYPQSPIRRLTITGKVTDPSGAAVAGLEILLQRSGTGNSRSTRTTPDGEFRFNAVTSGSFVISITNPAFDPEKLPMVLTDRSPTPLAIVLKLAKVKQELTVNESTTQVNTDSSNNLDTITLDREMLDSLPIFDQNYVGAMTRFLDPGSIGTSGVTLVVNGMEQRNIGVSASAIQSVKINQNPYSVEFSRPGRGRIEIITKPGSQTFHGSINFLFRDYHLNARDSFAFERPPEQRRIYEGSLTGPVGRGGKTSFVLSINRPEQDLQSIVFASTPTGIVQSNIANPQREVELSFGIIRQITENNVASFRGNYHLTTDKNRSAGGFVLPEAAFNYKDREDEFLVNDNLVISPKLLNQFRFLMARQKTPTTSVTNAPAIIVPGAFTGGGAQADRLQTEAHIALNDIVSWSKGKHEIRTGINVPDISRRGLNDRTNSLGTYQFATLADFQQNRPYSLIRQQGDGHVSFIETVVGGFFQDEYHLRPNLTISGGIRYDWQNFFHDNNNFAPRLSLAYSPDKKRKTVIRIGGGIFYDRTGPGPIFDLERYNGLRLQQIVITNPSYPITPNGGTQSTTLTRLDPTVHIPYTAQFSAGIERQLNKTTTITAGYWGTRGVSLFRSRDVNAPPPPNYLLRPIAGIGVYRQIESSGHLQNDALEISFRGKITPYFKGLVQYSFGRVMNDVPGNYTAGTRSTGINAFPANNYDLSREWARADFDQRHRLNLLGTIHAAKYLDFGIGFSANTPAPYTITTGRDDYHTGYANARPTGVARNSKQGPAYASLDLRWSHDFALQTERKEAPSFGLSLDAFNVTNSVNDTTFIGNLSSPFFGQAVSARPSRRLQLSLKFNF